MDTITFEFPAQLPPHDPDRRETTDGFDDESTTTNGVRAMWAERALTWHGKDFSQWERENFSDCIGDILHLAHSRGVDPAEVLRSAIDNFAAEAGPLPGAVATEAEMAGD